MHDMLCFALKNVPWKMDGEFCPADSCGSCSDRPRIGTASSGSQLEPSKFEGSLARKLRFYICHFHFLRKFSHESFVLTSSTFRF